MLADRSTEALLVLLDFLSMAAVIDLAIDSYQIDLVLVNVSL